MLTYEQIAIAESWIDSYKDMQKLIARMNKDLVDYQAKPEASLKRCEILKETILRMKFFVDTTDALIESQKAMLEKYNGLYPKHRRLLEEHQVLKAFAESKGCDLTLLTYLTLKDFHK